jgi:hypothetical protein
VVPLALGVLPSALMDDRSGKLLSPERGLTARTVEWPHEDSFTGHTNITEHLAFRPLAASMTPGSYRRQQLFGGAAGRPSF